MYILPAVWMPSTLFRIRIYRLVIVANRKRARTRRVLTIARNCWSIWPNKGKMKRIGTITNRMFRAKRKAKCGKRLPWQNHRKRKKMNSWSQLNGMMSWPMPANQKSSSLRVCIAFTPCMSIHLCDRFAAILGFTGLINQVQYHAALTEKGLPTVSAGWNGRISRNLSLSKVAIFSFSGGEKRTVTINSTWTW